MNKNSFLNKFKGRTEIVGKEGLLGIMNNLHMYIIGYPKPKKQLKSEKDQNMKMIIAM